jgi:hypothetical protein
VAEFIISMFAVVRVFFESRTAGDDAIGERVVSRRGLRAL